jgi:hypothetical protein
VEAIIEEGAMQFYPVRATNSIRISGGERGETEVYKLLNYIHKGFSKAGGLIVEGILNISRPEHGLRIHVPLGPMGDAASDPSYDPRDSDAEPRSTASDLLHTPGRGTDVVTKFYPWEWPGEGIGQPGRARDEVLLHELVHAYLEQRGISSLHNLKKPPFAKRVRRFDIPDDFYAIMITNVYCSERRRPIRCDHKRFTPLPRNAISVRHDPQFGIFFTSLASAAPGLVMGLKAISTDFNPWNPKPGEILDATAIFGAP